MEFFTVGERMLIYRRRLGLTKTELAERTGVSVSTVSKYEKDEVTDYDADVLAGFAAVLGVSINKLILGIESPERRKEFEALIQSR